MLEVISTSHEVFFFFPLAMGIAAPTVYLDHFIDFFLSCSKYSTREREDSSILKLIQVVVWISQCNYYLVK